MVCPMRFVLVGVSVCLAWIAAWRCMSSPDEAEQHGSAGGSKQGRLKNAHGSSSKQHAGALQDLLSWSTLLDMFTGRYLYNYCTGRGSASMVKAS